MEETLRSLFDFMDFDGNPALRRVIDSVHARCAVRELSLDEIGLISAAGEIDISRDNENK